MGFSNDTRRDHDGGHTGGDEGIEITDSPVEENDDGGGFEITDSPTSTSGDLDDTVQIVDSPIDGDSDVDEGEDGDEVQITDSPVSEHNDGAPITIMDSPSSI
jgi:hypothetical protein